MDPDLSRLDKALANLRRRSRQRGTARSASEEWEQNPKRVSCEIQAILHDQINGVSG